MARQTIGDDRGAPESPAGASGGPWMTREAVAAFLGCHVNHVDALRAAGLPWVPLGRAVRIHRDALEAYAAHDQWNFAATTAGR